MIRDKCCIVLLTLLLLPTSVRAFTTEARLEFALQTGSNQQFVLARKADGVCDSLLSIDFLAGETTFGSDAGEVWIKSATDSAMQEFFLSGYCPRTTELDLVGDFAPGNSVPPVFFLEEKSVIGNFTLRGAAFFASEGDRLSFSEWREKTGELASYPPEITSSYGWSIFRSDMWIDALHFFSSSSYCHSPTHLFLFDRIPPQTTGCQGKRGAFRTAFEPSSPLVPQPP